MASYEDMWKIPQHFQPDIGIYLAKVLTKFKENNLEPPNYVDVKRKLIKKYGEEKFQIFKPRIRPMLWKTHRLYEIGYDKGNLNFPGIATGGRKKNSNKKITCKRRRVRINSDGSYNQDDISHNKKCEENHMLGDNPWMKSVLNKKNAKGYDKYLKHLVKNRTKTVKNRKFKGGKKSKKHIRKSRK